MRRSLLTLLTSLAFLATLIGTLLLFAQDRIFDADSFSRTVAAALEEPAVNDYLAARDRELMSPLYAVLGISTAADDNQSEPD